MKLPKQPTDSQTTFWALWGDKNKKVNSEGEKKGREKAKQEGRGIPALTGKGSKIIGLQTGLEKQWAPT